MGGLEERRSAIESPTPNDEGGRRKKQTKVEASKGDSPSHVVAELGEEGGKKEGDAVVSMGLGATGGAKKKRGRGRGKRKGRSSPSHPCQLLGRKGLTMRHRGSSPE